MTADDLTGVIERTLREHAYLPAREYWSRPKCFCGEWQGLTATDDEPASYVPHVRHAAEAITAAITEHAEVLEQWGFRGPFSPIARTDEAEARRMGKIYGDPVTSRTIIRFPWKDVTTDER